MKIAATLILIFACHLCEAQDICYKKVQDKFTDIVKWKLKEAIRLDNITYLLVSAGGSKYEKTSFNLFFVCDAINSVDENSTCTFLFTDGTKQTIKHSGRFSLGGTFLISEYDYKLGGGAKRLNELLTKKIDAIRLDGYSRKIDIELTETEADDLKQKLNCLYAGWKAER